MDARTDAEVVIDGKVYTITGYEPEEYFHKIAGYLNNKLNEFNKSDAFRRLAADYRNVLMQINVADDFYKAKKHISELEEELQAKEKELYDLKHELVSYQMKQENLEKSLKDMEKELASRKNN